MRPPGERCSPPGRAPGHRAGSAGPGRCTVWGGPGSWQKLLRRSGRSGRRLRGDSGTLVAIVSPLAPGGPPGDRPEASRTGPPGADEERWARVHERFQRGARARPGRARALPREPGRGRPRRSPPKSARCSRPTSGPASSSRARRRCRFPRPRPRGTGSAPTASSRRSATAAWASCYRATRDDESFTKRGRDQADRSRACDRTRSSSASAPSGRSWRCSTTRTSRGCSTAARRPTAARTW